MKRLVGAGVVIAVLVGFSFLGERTFVPALLVLGVLAAAAVYILVADEAAEMLTVRWTMPPRFASAGHTFDPRFTRLAQQLSESADRAGVAVEVHRSLAAIADDLLASRYGVDRARDPAAARAVLGDSLSDYLDRPPSYPRNGFGRKVSALLTRLEEL